MSQLDMFPLIPRRLTHAEILAGFAELLRAVKAMEFWQPYPHPPMPTHLTRPLLACRLRDCGALDCPVCAGAEAARIYREQAECDHEEHDHGICLACGADITDELAGLAEDAADAAQDR